MSLPSTPAPAPTPTSSVTVNPSIVLQTPHMSDSSLVPVLVCGNFLKWLMCMKAYRTPYDHMGEIEPVKTSQGTFVDPMLLTGGVQGAG